MAVWLLFGLFLAVEAGTRRFATVVFSQFMLKRLNLISYGNEIILSILSFVPSVAINSEFSSFDHRKTQQKSSVLITHKNQTN